MQQDVVDLIMADHRELERIFDQLLSEPSTRPNLVPVMTTLLTAHERAEEAEVYPAARRAGGQEDVEHSQKEHLEADQLAQQVAAADPTSPDFEPLLRKLIDAVKHHVEEEEETLLPHMRENMEEADLRQLGEVFIESRKKHLGDQPEDITKQQLQQQAENADVEGTSGMSKPELQEKLRDEAES